MSRILVLIIGALLWTIAPAFGQCTGNFAPGSVCGNASVSPRVAREETLTDIIDRALGSTRGAILERGASGWQIIAPGTSGLPLVSGGAGSDPSYAAIGCNALPALTGDVTTPGGSCATTIVALPSTAFANPTASVGLSAVNGSATTAMRSDATPPLSQAIVPTWTGLHTFTAKQTTTDTGPAWATYSTIYNVVTSNINNFPVTSMAAANTGGVASAITGACDIPASAVNLIAFSCNGISGYARTANTQQAAVAIFGIALANAAGVNVFGANFAAGNTPQPGNITGSNLPNSGFTNVNIYGIEIDINVQATSVGGTPGGNIKGIYIIGNSLTATSGSSYGINIDSFGYTATPARLKWDSAFRVEAGAATIGLDLGASAATGSSLASQTIVLRGVNSGASAVSVSIQSSANGELNLIPQSGQNVQSVGSMTVIGTLGITSSIVQSGSVTGSQTFNVASTTSGTITWPAGTVNFSATGGTSQVVKQTSAGGIFTVARLACADLSDAASGCSAASGITALTADVTATGPGSVAATLATVNSNVGTFGSATQASQIMVNGKGLITAASSITVTPAVGSITGLGTGVATALAVNIGTAGSFVVNGGALGSPSSVGTLPAHTLGGTVSGGGNQINNVIIGTTSPLAITGTTITGSVLISNTSIRFNGQLASGVNASSGVFDFSGGNVRIFAVGADNSNTAGMRLDLYSADLASVIKPVWTAVANTGQMTFPQGISSTSKTTGSVIITGGLGVSEAIFTGTLNVITMANSTQANSVCYNTGTGLLTYNIGELCTTSSARFKDGIKPIIQAEALALVLRVQPVSFRYKPDQQLGIDERVGFTAEQVEKVDRRLVVHEADGITPRGVHYPEFTALLAGAIQQLKADNDNMREELHQLKIANGR